MSPNRRLDFEPELLGRFGAPPHGRPVLPRLFRAAFGVLVLVILLGLGAGISARTARVTRDKMAQTYMAMGLLDGLRTPDAQRVLFVCAEGEPSGLLREEEQRVFAPGEAPVRDEEALQERLDQIRTLRAELANQGVHWDNIVPLGVGGVLAQVFDSSVMREPVHALMGNVYFSSGAQVFTIQVSAWRCGHTYVIVEIWEWRPVDTPITQIKAHSEESFDRFEQDLRSAGSDPDIAEPKHFFVTL